MAGTLVSTCRPELSNTAISLQPSNHAAFDSICGKIWGQLSGKYLGFHFSPFIIEHTNFAAAQRPRGFRLNMWKHLGSAEWQTPWFPPIDQAYQTQ